MTIEFLGSLYTGSKFSSKYSFSDKDTTEENLIYSLAGFTTTITINIVDLDDQLTVAQTNATLSGTGLDLTSGARIRYAQRRLDMLSYSPSANPTFNVPNLTEFFNSGMPLGSVTFDLLRTV